MLIKLNNKPSIYIDKLRNLLVIAEIGESCHECYYYDSDCGNYAVFDCITESSNNNYFTTFKLLTCSSLIAISYIRVIYGIKNNN